MKLTFLGTRANVDARDRRHRRHAATLVAYLGTRVLVDCGEDWRGHLDEIAPDAIVLTHAHPDHAFGLADGAPCPVYATAPTWHVIDAFPVAQRRTIRYNAPFEVGDVTFEFVPVEHATRAPAGGYRIVAGAVTVFYVPDVVSIHGPKHALQGADLYVGDGATVERSLVRRVHGRLVGHTPIRTQLGWCAQHGVPRAVFTHCGSEVVTGDERRLGPLVRRLGEARGVRARIAYDGLALVLR